MLENPTNTINQPLAKSIQLWKSTSGLVVNFPRFSQGDSGAESEH